MPLPGCIWNGLILLGSLLAPAALEASEHHGAADACAAIPHDSSWAGWVMLALLWWVILAVICGWFVMLHKPAVHVPVASGHH